MSKIRTLYAVVVERSNGGQRMNSFSIKDNALKNAKEVINHIQLGARKNGKSYTGMKVYLSELDYDVSRNLIIEDHLINAESELLFEN